MEYMDVDVVDGGNIIRTCRKVHHYEALPSTHTAMTPIPELHPGELLHWKVGSAIPLIIKLDN